MTVVASLSAVSFPAQAAAASHVAAKPLPPGKVSNGPLKLPPVRPAQPPPPGSAAGKAVARFKAQFAASLAAPHQAPGTAQPPLIATAERKLAALKAAGQLTNSPVLAEWAGKARIRNVTAGPRVPVTDARGPVIPPSDRDPVHVPFRMTAIASAQDPAPLTSTVTYGAKYSTSAVSPVPTYDTPGFVAVTVTNNSNFTWNPSQIFLGYHLKITGTTPPPWYNFAGQLTQLGASVPPGSALQVKLLIQFLPFGNYTILPDLFDESQFNGGGPGWFSQESPPVPATAAAAFSVPHLAPTADLAQPLANATIDTTAPQFELIAKADGTEPVSAEFQVCTSPDATAACWQDSGWLSVPFSTGSFAALSLWTPPTLMNWNTTYYWRARVKDPLFTGAWSDFTAVTPVVPTPAGPAHYGADPASVDPAGVNLFLGNFTQQVTDIHVGGAGLPLQIQRAYNSADTTSTRAFGTGWSSLLDMQAVSNSDGTITITFPDGKQARYGQNPDGSWAPSYGQSADASVSGSAVVLPDGTKYTLANTGLWPTSAFLVTKVTGTDGSTLTMNIDGNGHVTQILAEPRSRSLWINWTGNHVTSVTTVPPGLTGGISWAYSYTGDELTKVCNPDGGCTSYGYGGTDSTHKVPRLTSIQRPDAANLAKITYAGDRVQDVAYPASSDGSSGTWTYGTITPSSTDPRITEEAYAEDPTGIFSYYEFDDQGSLLFRVMQSPNAGPSFTREWLYGFFGQVIGTLDETDRVTSYIWNNGLLQSVETDRTATGPELFTTTQYFTQGAFGDPRHGKPTSVTDANGNTTTYSYSPQGQLLTTLDPAVTGTRGDTINRYTCQGGAAPPPVLGNSGVSQPCGLLESSTDPNGQLTSYTYASNGDLARVVNPSGVQSDYVYDCLGRVTKKLVTTPPSATPAETDYTYNREGQVLTETDPAVTNPVTGVTHQLRITNTYDGDGNLTQAVQSDLTGGDSSRTVSYTYDARDRQATITDNGLLTSSTIYNGDGQPTESKTAAGADYRYFYDPKGNLESVWLYGFVDDPANPGAPRNLQLSAYNYDPAGRLTEQANAMGHATTYDYTYDGLRADQVFNFYTDPDTGVGSSLTLNAFTYDAVGNLVTDAEGSGASARTTTMTYDALNRRLTTTLSGSAGFSRTTTTRYDSGSRVTEVDAPDSVGYGYNGNGQLSTVATGLGQGDVATTAYTRDSAGNVLAATDADGNTTTSAYDILGRLSTTVAPTIQAETGTGGAPQAANPATTNGYDTFGDLTDIRDPNGNVTHDVYDQHGRRTKVEYPAYITPGGTTINATETWTYSPDGQVASHTDRTGNTISYLYDQRDRLVQSTRQPATAGGSPLVTGYIYDDDGNLLSRVDPAGAQTLWTYDDLDRPITVDQVVRNGTSTPTQIITNYRYDQFGDVISVASGSTQQNATYDAAGDLLTVTQTGRGTTTYAYNAMGEVTSITDGAGRVTTVAYDSAGRKTGVTTPAGTTTYTLDGNGNVIDVIDPRGNDWLTSYNALNQPVVLTDPAPAATPTTPPVTTFGYDAAGNQTRVTGPNGNATYQTYNAWNLPETTTRPPTATYPMAASGQTTITYNAGGQPSHINQPANGVDSIDNTYDNLGRLATQTGSSLDFGHPVTTARTFGYDADGNLTAISTPNGPQAFTYDDLGHLTGSTGPLGNSGYTYDGNGRLFTASEPGSSTARYTYNASTTDVAVRQTAAGVTKFAYNNDGQPVTEATTVGGTVGSTLSLSYDGAGRLSGQTLQGGATGPVTASASYSWDQNGNLLAQTQNTGSGAQASAYAYDADNRLVQSFSPTTGTGADYSWDGDGNRTGVVSWTGTPINRTTTDTVTATYDQRDELTSTTDPAADQPTTDYDWTPNGNLDGTTPLPLGRHCKFPSTIQWDAFGDPESFTTGGTETFYGYDALGRMTSSGGTSPVGGGTSFGYGGLSREPVSDGTTSVTRDPGGTATAVTSGTPALGLLQDAHGDITATYNPATGAVAGATNYDPFGQVTSTSGQALPLGYQGSWTDPTTGDLTAEARLYNPGTGTFLTPDPAAPPITDATGANPYLYANANPASYNDPTGHFGNPLSTFTDTFESITRNLGDVAGRGAEIIAENEAAVQAGIAGAEEYLAQAGGSGIGSEAVFAAEEIGIDAGAAFCAETVVCAAAAAAIVGATWGAAANSGAAGGGAGLPEYNYPILSPPSYKARTDQPGGGARPANTAPPAKPYAVSTSTWTVDGPSWTASGGVGWDSTYLYTYTDHFRYDTTYQQTLYSNNSLSPARAIGTVLVRWQTVQKQAILDFSHPVQSPAMSAAARQAFNNQIPGSPAEAPEGAGCGGGGPPTDCSQATVRPLPQNAEPQTATGGSGSFQGGGQPPSSGSCESDEAGTPEEGPSFFRGARPGQDPTFVPRPNEFRVDSGTGTVRPTHGLSVFDNSDSVASKGFVPFRLDLSTIPSELRIIQRGNDLRHFEIVPKEGTSLTPEQFSDLLCQIHPVEEG
jgi:RHS repeat-associated protein